MHQLTCIKLTTLLRLPDTAADLECSKHPLKLHDLSGCLTHLPILPVHMEKQEMEMEMETEMENQNGKPKYKLLHSSV